MKTFEKIMLLPAAAALSALLFVGCEKKNSDAAEPAQVEEAPTPSAAETAPSDHPNAEPAAEEAPAEAEPAAEEAIGENPPQGAPEEKAEHPKSDHPN